MANNDDPLAALADANAARSRPVQRPMSAPLPYATPFRPPPKAINGLGVASIIVALVALTVAWIPLVGFAAIPLAVIGGILGFVGLMVAISGGRSGVAFPLLGMGTSALAALLPFVMLIGTAAVISQSVPPQPQLAPMAVRSTPQTNTVDEILAMYSPGGSAINLPSGSRTLRVRGTIETIGKDPLNNYFVILKSESANRSRGVQCFFGSRNDAGIAGLQVGQPVIVSGRWKATGEYVQMSNCVVAAN